MFTDPTYVHYDGKTQLHLACKNGYVEFVKDLLNLGVDINKQDIDGNTALHIAKNIEIVKLLIEAGVNPNLQDYRSGFTPLLDSMVWWNTEKYNLLVPITDLNIKSSFGITPLILAAIIHSSNYIKLLLDAGADPYIRNFEGMDFYDFLLEDEKEYILNRLPEFLTERQLRLDNASIKALERRIR
jgi:ankyrin repeat protein